MSRIDVFDLFAKINLDTSEYDSGLTEASNRTSKFSESLQSIGSSVSNVGSSLTNNVSRPLLNIYGDMLQAGMDYEAGMDEVAAISGATGTEIDVLGKKAMEMAAKTKFSTAESAEAYKYMAMAGWETTDMLNALDAVMYLAGASGESLGATSDIVTDAMTAFGLAADKNSKVLKDGYLVEVSNAQRFTDVLAAASNNANTNVSMLGESFKFVAPVAGSMGYSIEDVAVALGLMANSGIKASMGGTALRTILTNLANPTDNMAAAMDALGVSLEDGEGDMYSLLDIMKQLRAGFGGGAVDSKEFADRMNELQTSFEDGTISEEEYTDAVEELATAMYGVEGAQKAQIASMLAGKYSMAGLLAIVSASDDDFNDLADAIYNSNGATEEMYNIMTDNAQGAVTMLDSAINVLFTSMSQHIIPIFTEVVRKITEVVNWFGSLDDGTQKLILTIGGIAIAVGPVLTVIGNIITAVGTISGAISGIGGVVSGVVKFVSSGITSILGIGGKLMGGIQALFALIVAHPVVAVVTAIIAAVVLLWNNCEAFRNAVTAIWEAIKGAFVSAWEGIKAAWDGAGKFFSDLWEGIKKTFENVVDFFKELFDKAAKAVQEAWKAVGKFFSDLWESIKAAFSTVVEFFSELFGAAAQAVQDAWNAVVEFFSGIWESIQEIFSNVVEFLGGLFQAAWEVVQNTWGLAVEFFTGLWDGIQAVFSGAAEIISGFFIAAWEAIQAAWGAAVEFFQGVWDGIRTIFEVVAEVIGGFFQAAWEAVQTAWSAAVEFFQGIWDGIRKIFEVVAEFLGGVFQKAWEMVKEAWGVAVEFFQTIWDGIVAIFEVAEEIIGGFFQAAADAVQAAWETIVEFFEGIWEGIVSSVDGVKEKIGSAFEEARNRVEKAFDKIETFFKGVVTKIVNVFSTVKSKFSTIGSNIVNGIKNGISSAWGTLSKFVTDKISALVTGVKKLLGIASPSKVFAGIGGFMAEGLGKGWDDEFGYIKKQIEGSMNFGTASIGVVANGSYSTSRNTQEGPQTGFNGAGGTTVNIYSPVAVDAVQAAREWKKTAQRMALGYV